MTKEGDRCVVRIDGVDGDRAADAFRKFLADVLPHCDDELPPPAMPQTGGVRVPRLLREGGVPVLPGAPVSTGIACAPAFAAHARVLTLPEGALRPASAESEMDRLQNALGALEATYSAAPARKGAEAEITKAHLSIVTRY